MRVIPCCSSSLRFTDTKSPRVCRTCLQIRHTCGLKNGHKKNGDDGIRTRDLSVANAALSQLSYVPEKFRAGIRPGSSVVQPTCLL